MRQRLNKIVTRTGDHGQTSLGDGTRVNKSSPRIDALGEIDELNSAIGLLLCEEMPQDWHRLLIQVQNDLFVAGSELSLPGQTRLNETHTNRLEAVASNLNAQLPPLSEFILPGGSRAAATAQLCRAICRRAERSFFRLQEKEQASPEGARYLNRLSDLLFILGRHFNQLHGQTESVWDNPASHQQKAATCP